MRTRVVPSHLRTCGRYARYRRRRDELIEQARFEAASWSLALCALVWMLYLGGMAVSHG